MLVEVLSDEKLYIEQNYLEKNLVEILSDEKLQIEKIQSKVCHCCVQFFVFSFFILMQRFCDPVRLGVKNPITNFLHQRLTCAKMFPSNVGQKCTKLTKPGSTRLTNEAATKHRVQKCCTS